ncbi:salivary gland secretion 1 [Rhodotorula toruloides]|uniref:Salivary gland secretion 1 n=1 Tax=Rhodotorula toruloides TaxID=5286 RepID=A0A511KQN3_RHOTO|nr:salivary gland secretion 1 [Rhodotorula toruloides]
MSEPVPAFRNLFPPSNYPLSHLLNLFIDLYESLHCEADPSGTLQAQYQGWFELWWDYWCRNAGYSIPVFYCPTPSGSLKDPWRTVSDSDEAHYMRDFREWSTRQRNTVARYKYRRNEDAPRYFYFLPNITVCAQLRREDRSLIQQFEPWNKSGIEYSVTHARAPDPGPPVRTVPPASLLARVEPPTHATTHTTTERSRIVEPSPFFTDPGDPLYNPHDPRLRAHFRSLAHCTSHALLDQYSHRQRAIYGID